MFDTPVLLLIFNRPQTTAKMMDRLRQLKPQKVYIAADGPRTPEEKELTDTTRSIALQIDWPCQTESLFRQTNLGLRSAVSEAITWFFEKEEAGIILEDDCLPTSDFFSFCASLLEKYEHTPKVMHISGFSIQHNAQSSYHFSKYPRVWGWATWRRAWAHYNDRVEDSLSWLNGNTLRKMMPNRMDRAFWQLIIEKMALPQSKMRHGSWAYFWALSIRAKGGLCITPHANLIETIGFGADATHMQNPTELQKLIQEAPIHYLQFPLAHPTKFETDESMDTFFLSTHLIDSRYKRLKIRMKMLFPFLKPLS